MTRFATTYAQFTNSDPVDNARKAAQKIAADLAAAAPSLIVFFAATNYDPDTLAREVQAAFPGAVTFGCTSSGEAVGDKMLRQSVTAMAFAPEVFEHCGMALVLEDGPASEADGVFGSVDAAMKAVAEGTNETLLDLDYRRYVGFMLVESISRFSQNVIERVGELTNVLYVGGVAGDDYKFSGETRVFFKGKAYRRAAVIGLWKPTKGFSLLKTQAAEAFGKTFTITRADEDKHIVWELDGKDAAPVYLEALGVPPEQAGDVSIYDFDVNPPALIIDGEPFLFAIFEQVEGKGLRMFAAAKKGQRLTATRVGDLLKTTGEALAGARREAGDVSAILHVNCVARTTGLEQQGSRDAYGKLFGDVPSVSFASYGEVYVGLVAMTSPMILFK